MSRTVLIATGSYSSTERGRGRGIELLSLEVGDHADGHDTALTVSRRAAVELPDPSFVLWSPDGSGTVETVRLDADGLPVELIDVDDHHDHADGLDPHPH